MAARVAAAPAPGGAQAEDQYGWVKGLIRNVAIFGAVQMGARYFFSQQGNQTQAAMPKVEPASFPEASPAAVVGAYNPVPQAVRPMWPANSSVDLSIFVSFNCDTINSR